MRLIMCRRSFLDFCTIFAFGRGIFPKFYQMVVAVVANSDFSWLMGRFDLGLCWQQSMPTVSVERAQDQVGEGSRCQAGAW